MALQSDGSTGGGAGGTGGYSPSQQKQDNKNTNSFNSAVKKAQQSISSNNLASSPSSKDPPVYLGAKYKPGTQNYYDMVRRGHSTDNVLSLSQAQQMYFGFDQKTRDKFMSQLQLAGYDASTLNDNKMSQLWAGYVAQAAGYYASGKKVSPWDVISKDMTQREASGAAASQARTVTSTQTQAQLSSRTDASALFEQAASSLMGRAPTKSESAKFFGALNKYEKANPQTTTTTSNYSDVGDLTSQSSTSKGGVSADARAYLAEQQAKADPEYGAYQAATTYMGALMQAIKGV